MASTMAETESSPARFPVQLDRFEGPLDLLLEIIKQNKEEIWEISISQITQQYLDHLGTLQALNIEIAGEYLVMAATLMRMKSQMLLPRPSFVLMDEDEDEPLTREGLIAKLLEYRRIKEAALHLKERETRQGSRFVRGTVATLEKGYQLPLREPRLIDLVRYMHDVLERDDDQPGHQVELEELDLDDQMEWVRAGLRGEVEFEPHPSGAGSGVRFSRLLRTGGAIMEIVVTFLAVLELSKGQRLRTWQLEPFEEIWLSQAEPETETDAAEMELPAETELPADTFLAETYPGADDGGPTMQTSGDEGPSPATLPEDQG